MSATLALPAAARTGTAPAPTGLLARTIDLWLRDRRRRGPTVRLPAEDAAYADAVAATRRRTHLGTDRRRHFLGDEANDRLGAAGEVAAARALGLPRSVVDARGRLAGDDGVDFRLPDGRTVDVKTTDRPDRNLIADVDRLGADLYVLVEARGGTRSRVALDGVYELVGWATAEELRAAPVRRARDPDRPFRCLPRRRLRPFLSLLLELLDADAAGREGA